MAESPDPCPHHWRIETSGEALTADPVNGSLVLRLGMAINSIRAAQRFYEAARQAPGPAGLRDRFYAFLIAVAFLSEALQILRPNYPRVRALAEAGGIPSGDIEEAGALLSGRGSITKLLGRIRNRLVFHWDDELVLEFIAGFSKATVVWVEGIGPSKGDRLYRASADTVGQSVLPAAAGEELSDTEDIEGVHTMIVDVTTATRPVLSMFEYAIAGHIASRATKKAW